MRKNPWPAVVLVITLIVVAVVGIFGIRYMLQKSDEYVDVTVEEVPAENEASPVGGSAVNADEDESYGDPTNKPKYTEYCIDNVTIRPEKWEITALGEMENLFFTYNNDNKVACGSPTSWQCYLSTSDVADMQMQQYADEDRDEVISKYNLSVNLYGTSAQAVVYEYIDTIDIVSSYRNVALVVVECFTTDIEVARKSFEEAMDVTIIRK